MNFVKIGQLFCLLAATSCCSIISFFATAEQSAVPPVVVAGAGPASLMFTLRYLQLNPEATVEIFERRDELPRWRDGRNRDCIPGAYGFGIAHRPKAFLEKIPGAYKAIEAVASDLVFLPGQPALWVVDRSEFCAELIHLLNKRYGNRGEGRLRINFGSTVKAIEGRNETSTDGAEEIPLFCALVEDKRNSDTRSVPYSMLIGADGGGSGVRTFLIKEGKIQGKRFKSRMCWKALPLPQQPKLKGKMPTHENSGHINKNELIRILPKYKGRYVLLHFRHQNSPTENPFGAKTPKELKEGFQNNLPNYTEFPPDSVIQEFLDQRPGMSCHMKLNSHYVPELQVMLLGDAAVGMYSLLGQGCAYAIEAAMRLAEAMAPLNLQEELEGGRRLTADQEQVLAMTAGINQKEGQAIADLNLMEHVRTRALAKWISQPAYSDIMEGLFDTSTPYSSIAHRNRFTLKMAKFFWLFDRMNVPLAK